MNGFACKCLLACFLIALFGQAANYEKLPELERKIVDLALKINNLTIDNSPETKKIRNYYFYTQDPFESDDKFLSWINHLQYTTQDRALRAQLWIEPGQTFNKRLILENEQLLINPAIRSFALIFPVQLQDNPSETEVDLLIVSKDIFSWQTNYSIGITGGTLNSLSLGFAQSNLLGLNKTLGFNFNMNPALMTPSLYYSDPILFSTKNQLSVQQGVVLNRDGFGFEGVNGSLQLMYPIAIETAPWGYNASLAYNYQPVYDFQGSGMRTYEGYKRQYRQLQINPTATVIRSLGVTNKSNFSFGYGFNLGQYEALENVPQNFIDAVLPVNQRQSYLIAGYNFFQNRFLTLYDYNTFSLTEFVQLGPIVNFSNNFGLRFLGSQYYFLQPSLSSGYNFSLGKDSWFSLSGSITTRYQGPTYDNQASASIVAVFPTLFKFGRFVGDAIYTSLWNRQSSLQFTLGGSSGLRGVPYRYYQGNNLIRTNLEFRTRSVPWWIFRFGLVVFYDFGSAFNQLSNFNPTHDVGLGLRILTVPWNRMVIRIDGAVPVYGPFTGSSNTLVTVGIGQAF